MVLIKLANLYDKFGGFRLIKDNGEEIPLKYEDMKKFDLDLEFGQMGEKFVEDLQNGNTMIEVKTERDIWKTTGNLAVEIRYKGRPSGISTTGSNVWIHLLSDNNKIVGGYIFSVDYLKQLIIDLKKQGKLKLVMGGDFNQSQMALIPRKELFKTS
jgi:hypothetical protein|tara:strand:- start:566 stop:1033 length:468 start_codon:yes stop_codon:yes gene_type:complete